MAKSNKIVHLASSIYHSKMVIQLDLFNHEHPTSLIWI